MALHDGLQRCQVSPERVAPGRGQRDVRQRLAVSSLALDQAHVAGGIECPQVRREVPIGEVEQIAHLRERERLRRGQRRDNGEPAFDVDGFLEFAEPTAVWGSRRPR